jgi:hypothetical protein
VRRFVWHQPSCDDNDRLTDGEEIALGTNSLRADSDGINDKDDSFSLNATTATQLGGTFSEKFAVSGCKTSVRASAAEIDIIPGNYLAELSDGLSFAGAHRVIKPAAKYQLDLSVESRAALIDPLSARANNICTGGVSVQLFTISKYQMTLNKQNTQLKISAKANLPIRLLALTMSSHELCGNFRTGNSRESLNLGFSINRAIQPCVVGLNLPGAIPGIWPKLTYNWQSSTYQT